MTISPTIKWGEEEETEEEGMGEGGKERYSRFGLGWALFSEFVGKEQTLDWKDCRRLAALADDLGSVPSAHMAY